MDADIIGHSEPVLQPAAVVTDLWQASQISGLRILALRIRRHTPRLLRAAGTGRCGHLNCLVLLWLLNCHMLPRAAHRIRVSFVYRTVGTSRSREAIATKSDCRGVGIGYSACLESVGSAPVVFRRSDEEC